MGIFHIFFAVSSLFPKNQDGQKQSAVGKSSGPSNFKNPMQKGAANQAPFRTTLSYQYGFSSHFSFLDNVGKVGGCFLYPTLCVILENQG